MRAVRFEARPSKSPRAGASVETQARVLVTTPAIAAAVVRPAGENRGYAMDSGARCWNRETQRSGREAKGSLEDHGRRARERFRVEIAIALLVIALSGAIARSTQAACDTVATPTGVAVFDNTSNVDTSLAPGVVVSWAEVPPSEGYFVYRTPDSRGGASASCPSAQEKLPYGAVFLSGATSFVDSRPSATAGATYFVRAFRAGGICLSAPSASVALSSAPACAAPLPEIESASWVCYLDSTTPSPTIGNRLFLTVSAPTGATNFHWYFTDNNGTVTQIFPSSQTGNTARFDGSKARSGWWHCDFDMLCGTPLQTVTRRTGSFLAERQVSCRLPSAGFTASSADAAESALCATAPVQFRYQKASATDPEPDTFFWQFGDGSISSERDPSHSYASACGASESCSVSPSLQVTYLTLQDSSSSTLSFVQPRPVAIVTESLGGESALSCAPVTLLAFDPGTGGVIPEAGRTFTWYLDGQRLCGLPGESCRNQIVADQPGTYELKVVSALSTCPRLSAAFHVDIPLRPDPSFEQSIVPKSCDRTLVVTARSSLPAEVPVEFSEIAWYRDGVFDPENTKETYFLTEPNESVTVETVLFAKTSAIGFLCPGGHEESVILDRTPNENVPLAISSPPRDLDGRCPLDGSGETVFVVAQEHVPNTQHFRYTWWVDGIQSPVTTDRVSVSGAGLHSVACEVRNANGCTLQQSTQVDILRCAPRAVVTVDGKIPSCAGQVVRFRDLSVYAVENREWTFSGDLSGPLTGDPGPDVVEHIFPLPDNLSDVFAVDLVVSNTSGSDSARVEFQFSDRPPRLSGIGAAVSDWNLEHKPFLLKSDASDSFGVVGGFFATEAGTFPTAVLTNPEGGLPVLLEVDTARSSADNLVLRRKSGTSVPTDPFIGRLEISKSGCGSVWSGDDAEPFYVAFLESTQALPLLRKGPGTGGTMQRVFPGQRIPSEDQVPVQVLKGNAGQFQTTGTRLPDGSLRFLTLPLSPGSWYDIKVSIGQVSSVKTPTTDRFKSTTFAVVTAGDQVLVADVDPDTAVAGETVSFVDLDPSQAGAQTAYQLAPDPISSAGTLPPVVVESGVWKSAASGQVPVALAFVGHGSTVERFDLATLERPETVERRRQADGPFLDEVDLGATKIIDLALGTSVADVNDRTLSLGLIDSMVDYRLCPIPNAPFCNPRINQCFYVCQASRYTRMLATAADPNSMTADIVSTTTLADDLSIFFYDWSGDVLPPTQLPRERVFPKRMLRSEDYLATSYATTERPAAGPSRAHVLLHRITDLNVPYSLVNRCSTGAEATEDALVYGIPMAVIRDKGRIAYLDAGGASLEQFPPDVNTVDIQPDAGRRLLSSTSNSNTIRSDQFPNDLSWTLVKPTPLTQSSRVWVSELGNETSSGRLVGYQLPVSENPPSPPTRIVEAQPANTQCTVGAFFRPIAISPRWQREVVTEFGPDAVTPDGEAWIIALDAGDGSIKAFDAITGGCKSQKVVPGLASPGAVSGLSCLLRGSIGPGLWLADKEVKELPPDAFTAPAQQAALVQGFEQLLGWLKTGDEPVERALGRAISLQNLAKAAIVFEPSEELVVAYLSVAISDLTEMKEAGQ